MIRYFRIKKIDRPLDERPDKELQWLFHSMGLQTGRDIEDTSLRVFKELVNLSAEQKGVRCEELARRLDIKQARVNHHIRIFIEAGLIVRDKARLYIRGGSLQRSVQELRKDVNRMLDDWEEAAIELDQEFGFRKRSD
ncbi:helix-turn-helix transcriptional regulator [Candidatus Woesearchaeota archaeon]|nr:helix-turn-helix transcriptional regulator [Candidatus Woesearchaeota archaeon]